MKVHYFFSEEVLREKHRNPRPSSSYSCSDETDIDGGRKPLVDVFLLSLPGSMGSRSEDIHAMFRQWVKSLGCNVFDMNDPEMVRTLLPGLR